MKFSEGVLLAQDPLNGCSVVRGHVHHIYLSPRYLNGGITRGVKEILTNQLGRYNNKLDGILLSFSNIKLMQNNAVLLYDNVEMHFDIQYDVVIFRVVPGSLLKCIINEVSTDHISCLIHKTINVALALPDVSFDARDPKGMAVVCRVNKVEYKKGVLGLSGELTGDSLQTLQELYTEVYNTSLSIESQLAIEANEDIPQDGEDEKGTETSQRNGTKQKKKKKKRKTSAERSMSSSMSSTVDDQQIADSLIESDNKKKHKKHKKKLRKDRTEIDSHQTEDELPSPHEHKEIMKMRKSKNVDDESSAVSLIKTGKKRKHSKKKTKDKEGTEIGRHETEGDLPSPSELIQKKKAKKKQVNS